MTQVDQKSAEQDPGTRRERPRPRSFGVIGALDKEVADLVASLARPEPHVTAGLTVYTGLLGDVSVATCTAGMGTVNVAAAAQVLVSTFGAQALVLSGIAGNLNPQLGIGDVVVGQRLEYLDTDVSLLAESAPHLESFESDATLARLALRACKEVGVDAIAGTIATGNRFVSDPARAREIVAATGADCVEMEGAAVAHVAAKNGIPSLVIRAMSDNCDEDYETFVTRELDLEEYARTAASITRRVIELRALSVAP